ncbi:MAG: Smr/MutS family protein [Saprospiraceae bacterium]
MRTVSIEVLKQLEFNEIIALASKSVKGPGGLSYFENIHFNYEMQTLNAELNRLTELVEILLSPESIVIHPYDAIANDLFYLKKENYTLDSAAVLRINRILLNFKGIDTFFFGKKRKDFTTLANFFEYNDFYSPFIRSISRIFDEQGDLKKDATPELARIFRMISSKEKEIDKVFDRILSDYKSKGLLSDSSESIKSGRRVLALPAENKRIVKGIIHDESSSGKTVFIEPSGVIQVNNLLIELENEKRKEVFKILKELSNELRSYTFEIEELYNHVAYFDFLSCKAHLAISMDAIRPKLTDKTCLHLKKSAHPLLKHKEMTLDGFKVVPFDLMLKKDNRILLISGPNAGGKTVTLKAIGLIHLMVYSGFLVPVEEGSVIGDFKSIFANIGDLQNLDEGLSTYSSHLESMNHVVKNVNNESLILIDEFGSGTDPKVGGAIAESILRRFNHLKAYGIITTHYSSLKVFAYKEKGVVNGAMHFNEKELAPTYKLHVGAPGSSYAFEVAYKIGLHPALIKYARKKVGRKENAIEHLLVSLQKEKAEYDEKLRQIYDERNRLDQLIQSYDQMNKDLIIKKKKHKIRLKENKIAAIETDRIKIDQVIKTLAKEKKLEDAKMLREELKQKRTTESYDVVDLKQEILEVAPVDYIYKIGDHVAFVDGDTQGIIKKIKKKNADILSGNMIISVALSSLRPIRKQIEISRSRKINIDTSGNTGINDSKLDIRGYNYQDAAQSIEEFLDNALLGSSSLLEVIHGKGSGVLRKLLLKKLKEYKDVKKVWHPKEEGGGQGSTLIKF